MTGKQPRYASRTLAYIFYVVTGVTALTALVVYLVLSSATRGYVPTTGEIVGFKEMPTKGGRTTLHTQVTYEVDGDTYTEYVDFPYPQSQLGQEIEIVYNPDDPTDIDGNLETPVLVGTIAAIGGIFFILAIIFHIASRKKKRSSLHYSPSPHQLPR